MNTNTPIKVALTGDVTLELAASYFRDAGYDVMPQDVSLEAFRPDFVCDLTAHEAELSREVPGFYDARMQKLAGCRFSAGGLRAIVEEFDWLVASRRAKVLAVDADNTLWAGVLGEDGPDALRPCAVFQRGLKALSEAGVVLVLLSKNDECEVLSFLSRASVDPALLAPGDFAERRVGWDSKAGNLVAACRALNLGTESVVFVDDSAHERAQMKAHLPEVGVAPWTGWTADEKGDVPAVAQAQLVRRLRTYFFSGSGLTDEDRLRARDYRAAAERFDAARRFASHDDYLDDLGLWVAPSAAKEADLDRLAQMAAKTNQFNATTLRRTRDDFAQLLRSSAHRVFVFRAGDRFGEQGLVCYVVVDLSAGRITDFVMSCRAMGRTLEHFALAYVEKRLGRTLAIDFAPTAKNRPFADFLAARPQGARTHFKERG